MKTLKQLLEFDTTLRTPQNKGAETSMEPRGPDEKRFKDKHKVEKTADRNGNGDDVFNASNVKSYERTNTRHGYNTGDDAKVYESKQPKSLADLLEKKLTSAEIKKREEVAQAIERENPDMPMAKKMAIATSTAKKVAEEADLEEALHPMGIHVKATDQKKDGQVAYKVHAVGKDVEGIEPGEHLNDSELDDLHDMGHKIKMSEDYEGLFNMFDEDLQAKLWDLFNSLNEENKDLMVGMVEDGEYDLIVDILNDVEGEQ